MLNEYVHFHKNHRIFVCTLESEKHWSRGNYAVDSLSLEAKGKQLCPHACTHTHTHTHCSGANGTTERHPCSSLNYPQAGTQCSAISHPSTPPPLPWVLDPWPAVTLSHRHVLRSLTPCYPRKMIIWLLSFMLLMWWTTFTDLHVSKSSLRHKDEPLLTTGYINPFNVLWIPFCWEFLCPYSSGILACSSLFL